MTHSTLQLGLAVAGLFAGIGATLLLTGFGVIRVGRGKPAPLASSPVIESIPADKATV